MRLIYYSFRVCEKSTPFSFSELMRLVHISVSVPLNHTLVLSSCFYQQYVCSGPKKNPDNLKCPKPNRLSSTSYTVCARFCFLNSFSLFVFPPSSGLTPSQYAVSVLERKSQIGTSGQKSCCPVQTVGAVVSRPCVTLQFLDVLTSHCILLSGQNCCARVR